MSKVWLVTGSGRGLGREIVLAALAAGDRVVATARDPQQLADLQERYGERIRPVALDVSDATGAGAAVEAALATFGRLDVLVNNAGSATWSRSSKPRWTTFARRLIPTFMVWSI